MPLSRFVYTLFSGILVTQLVYTSVAIPVAEYSFGVTAQFSKAPKRVLTPSPSAAFYTSQKQSYESVLFVGDVLLARNVEYLMNQHGPDYPYRGLSFTKIVHNPAVVGNFESSIPKTHTQTPAQMMTFSVSETFIPELANAGFTHVSQANNHAYDYLKPGYTNATKILEQNNIEAFGHPEKTDISSIEFITVQDKVVAVMPAYTLQQLPAYSELKDVFEYASARSDIQIVYVHWGTEYVSVHNSRQREAAERFVAAGADLIVGHHPHVVQDIELINGVPVFYSLGNYIFDQYDSLDTQEGLMLHLELSQPQLTISLLPVTSVGTLSQPRFMKTQEHALFLEKLAKRSDVQLRDFIKSGVILIGTEVASSSKVAIMSQ